LERQEKSLERKEKSLTKRFTRSSYPLSNGGKYFDIFDGRNYKINLEKSIFHSEFDVALGLTADGAKIFKNKLW
jgi:hypothetical protein